MKKTHKKILNVLLTILAVVGIIIGLFFVLKALGVTDQESLQRIIKSTGAWGPIVFFLLQVAVTTTLSVIPGMSMTFLVLSGILFDNVFLAVSLSLVSVWVSSILMFTIGNTLGEKVAIKLVGAEDMSKAQELIDTKSKVYLPIMLMFPFFPDDALCLAAGLTKMKYSYFIPVVMIFRSFGVLTTVLTTFYHQSLFSVLGFSSLQPIHWVMLVNLAIFDVYAVFKFTTWLEKKMNRKKKEEVEEQTQSAN